MEEFKELEDFLEEEILEIKLKYIIKTKCFSNI